MLRKVVCAVAFVSVCLFPVRAEELLLVDKRPITIEGDWAWPTVVTPAEFPEGVPNNWKSPVDYCNGSMEFRLDVLSYASEELFQIQPIIWGNMSTKPIQEAVGGWYKFQGTGVHTFNCTLCGFGTNNSPDYTNAQSWTRIGLGFISKNDCYVGLNNSGHFCVSEAPTYYPFKLNLWVVIISAGSSFSGWETYIGSETDAAPRGTTAAHTPDKSSIQITRTGQGISIRRTEQGACDIELFSPSGERVVSVGIADGADAHINAPLAPGMYVARIKPVQGTTSMQRISVY